MTELVHLSTAHLVAVTSYVVGGRRCLLLAVQAECVGTVGSLGGRAGSHVGGLLPRQAGLSFDLL